MTESPSGVTRSDEWFHSHGTRCAAAVYRPAGTGTAPVIVMAHGLGGTRVMRLFAYAERFAAAGYGVVVFDYRGFGDSEGEPRRVIDVGSQLADWRAGLAFARSLEWSDDRIVAWGTSFSGGHVLTLAGTGVRLAAIVSQVPHVSGPAAVRSTGLRSAARVALPALKDQVNAWRGRPPVYVAAADEAGTTALMSSPDALSGVMRLFTDSGVEADPAEQVVAARIGLWIGTYSPGKRASSITCPTLVQIAERDAVTPAAASRAVAAKIRDVTVRSYDCGHFDPYVEPTFTAVIADQLEFLQQHVPVAQS